ncbi:MAG TPA: type II secretion system F family protein [Pyrinomonadaceae bacterium]|nr:type II secretion system F family protein [Pyrinomonadaceae bacterium]
MLISTVVFLFFLFLTYAIFLLTTRKADARQMRLQKRVAEALQDFGSQDHELKLSREDSIGGHRVVNQILTSLDLIKRLDQTIRQAGLQITVSRLLVFCLLAGTLALFAALTVMNLFMSVVPAVIAASLPLLYVSYQRKKRLHKINAQLPDTLDLLGRSLAVGHAFSEALNQVQTEMPDPIATEFRIVFEEQKLGLSTKVALDRLTERVPLTDLRLCVTAMHIQRETGGNLSEILEKVSQTVRERFKLMEDFRTLTTSSRGSAWILCLLPFGIVFLLTIINPEYMALLLHDQRGHYILAVAAILQILGIITIKKILAIKV